MLTRFGTMPATSRHPDLRARLGIVGTIGLAALAAVAFGAFLPERSFQALVLLALVPLAFAAPVASLAVVLFITVLVPFDVQNDLAVVGGRDVPGLLVVDVLLLLGLCRVAVLLAAGRLRAPRIVVLAGGLGLVVAAGLVEGLANGAGASDAGHEARRVMFGVGAFILAWPLLDNDAARRRLYGVLLAAGLALGAWGLGQWLFGLDYVSAGDVGVRPGVDETSGGRGQLQGAMYAYPVAVALAFAALVSGGVRSLQARWLLGAIVVLNAVCLLLTYERTLWAAAAVGCLMAAVKSGREARRAAATWGTIGVVAVLVALLTLGELGTATERLVSVAQYRTDRALEHREVESKHVVQAIAERPLTGSGFGVPITWGKEGVFATQTTSFAHNGYLWLGWKIGVPAAVLFVLALGAAVLRRGPPPHDRRLTMLQTGSQAALAGLLLINVTFPAFNALGITAVMGLLAAICLRPRPSL